MCVCVLIVGVYLTYIFCIEVWAVCNIVILHICFAMLGIVVITYIHSQSMNDRSADEDSLSSSCQGLENICTRTYASIHVDLATTCDCFYDILKCVNLQEL